MRAVVAKRLRRMTLVISGKPASDGVLVRETSNRKHKKYNTAINRPECGRYCYQNIKKDYHAKMRGL